MNSEKGTSFEPNRSSAAQSPASFDSNSKICHSFQGQLENEAKLKRIKKRRAKACTACRARKVRCHITAEGQVTCSNYMMGDIKCVKSGNGRLSNSQSTATAPLNTTNIDGVLQVRRNSTVKPLGIVSPEAQRWSKPSSRSNDLGGDSFTRSHVTHAILETLRKQSGVLNPSFDPADPMYSLLTSASYLGDRTRTRLVSPPPPPPPMPKHKLPDYLKPLPHEMSSVDIDYLFAKGALSLPGIPLRNALLRSYLEYVHPYMPLIEVHEVLHIIDDGTGDFGRISLLLFQAIMFAGTAFVDMDSLYSAGYSNRKSARSASLQKATVLYNCDYEIDCVSLVQSLLLMTYWYETEDEQKNTWHWMGVVISLAHTIGLHRNHENSNMEPKRKKLWKRIWWSCFMRDSLVALGMHRPTRVKDEDYDVPMLTEQDFEIEALCEANRIIPRDCTLARDIQAQRELAQMCIAQAKLCLCISHVFNAQYSVLVRHQEMQGQEGSTHSSVMVIPKKLDQTGEVKRCDIELSEWINELPETCVYSNHMDSGNSGPPIFVHRALLHMVYFAALSALHRSQIVHSASMSQTDHSRESQNVSQKKVREASREITRISQHLQIRGLEKYLPATGVTVILPAGIIHLLDIKSCNDHARQAAIDGFWQCMLVLLKLREYYSSAGFGIQLLEAAIRKANIDVVMVASKYKTWREDAQGKLNFDNLKDLCERSTASRRTPPISSEEPVVSGSIRLDNPGSHMMDINTHSDRLDNYICGTVSSSQVDDVFGTHLYGQLNGNMNGAEGTGGPGQTTIDLNDIMRFDGADMGAWNVPLGEDVHGNWIDREFGWS